MSGRYQQAGREDEQQVSGDGDRAFLGVDMRNDPTQVAAGFLTDAQNIVFQYGCAEPRRGFQTKPWAYELSMCFPFCFPSCFTNPIGLGKVLGTFVLTAPVGQERLIIACERTSYSISPGAPPTTIPYPTDITLTEEVHFTQAFNVVIMWRGERANPLKLETPIDFTDWQQRWEEVPDETNGDYTETIPDADRALYYGNRIWVPFDNDRLAFSDLLAYTRYDPTLSTIYLNEGANDRLQILFPYGQNSIVAFKTKTIMHLVNVLPEPLLTAHVQMVSITRGTIAPDSVAQVGNDVWFLSDDGVYSLSQAFDNALLPGTIPLSAPIQPIFDRITWACADRAQGVYHDAKYFLAVPIDDAQFNNAILIYDFVNNGWAGYWTGPWFDIFRWVRLFVYGQRRLGFVSKDNVAGGEGLLFMLGDDYTDECLGVESEIETELVSRGYTAQMPGGDKAFLVASVEVDSWDGAGTIDGLRDGVNEEGFLGAFDKNRLKYDIWPKADYDPANVNDDHGAPYRQDYSVALLAEGVELGSGVALGLHQRSSERMRVRQMGTHLQLRLRSLRGRVKLNALGLGARAEMAPIRKKL